MQLRSDRTLNSRPPHYRWLSEANVGQVSESQVRDRPRVYHDWEGHSGTRAMHIAMHIGDVTELVRELLIAVPSACSLSRQVEC